MLTSFREGPVCPPPVNPDKAQKLPGAFLRIKGLCAVTMANHYPTASHKPATRPPSRAPLREVTHCLWSGTTNSKLFSAPPACEPLLLLPAAQPGDFFYRTIEHYLYLWQNGISYSKDCKKIPLQQIIKK
jgi:hypothetical protein